MTVAVWYEDGSQDVGMYNFDVVDGESSTTTSVNAEMPMGWEQLIKSNEYTLASYETTFGDKIFYLKPNVVVTSTNTTSNIVELFYNETNKNSYSLYYIDNYENLFDNYGDLIVDLTASLLPSSEEEFNEFVASGQTYSISGKNATSYQELADHLAKSKEILNSITEVSSSGVVIDDWNVTVDNNIYKIGNQRSGVNDIAAYTDSYVKLPKGGYLVLSISPLQEFDVSTYTDIEDLTLMVNMTDNEVAAINESSSYLSTFTNEAKMITSDCFGYVTLNDLSWYNNDSASSVKQETVVSSSEQSTPEVTESPVEVLEAPTMTVSTERNKTYQEKYPNLYKWPDQQSIYGMSPKLFVYDLLSKTGGDGQIAYETCLVPIWGINEHKFLNDMDFYSGSNSRQNATTTLSPSTTSTSSGLFGNTTQSGNRNNNTNNNSNNNSEFGMATLNTSFGNFEIKGEYALQVDESKSSKAQISIKDNEGNYYRIISTTAASIEKQKTKPMYDIEGINLNTWQCIKGAQETTVIGTITRYYVTYHLENGTQCTAEYFYVISTGNGYLMVMPDEAITTTSNVMYNICKLIKEK